MKDINLQEPKEKKEKYILKESNPPSPLPSIAKRRLSSILQSHKKMLLARVRLKKRFKHKLLPSSDNETIKQFEIDFKNPKDFFKKAKDHFKSKINISKLELTKLSDDILAKEAELTNISKTQKLRWRNLQKKLLFVSLLRRSVTIARKYGIVSSEPTMKKDFKPTVTRVRKRYIIYPDNSFLVIHALLLSFFLIYLVIFFPLDIAFDLDTKSGFFLSISILSYLYFFFDICIGFILAFERAGKIIDSPKEIIKHYLTWWLLIDIAATFPLDAIFQQGNLKINGFLKIPKLILIMKSIFGTGREEQEANKTLSDRKLKMFFSSSRTRYAVRTLILILLFVHTTACIWIFLLRYNSKSNWYTK